ncbi:TPA: ferrous iron transporter B [Candidatus Micrarchaeota archaeon]|nr:ferrous iron transporter B [Candidatus Micrarchaeota archaeon]
MGMLDIIGESCCGYGKTRKTSKPTCSTKKIRIALAGNANVGKSALFNYLTGLHQHVANWPGKTVEMAEGSLCYKNYEIDIIDLPGIYSLSTFSKEEKVTREYIEEEKPDVVINVVDSCALERNLFFTLQLLELEVPVVLALNQSDGAKKRGILIDEKKLSEILGIPVVKTVATTGAGVGKLLTLCTITSGLKRKAKTEKGKINTDKRYLAAGKIARKTMKLTQPKELLVDKIDELTTHGIFGYIIMLVVLGVVFYSIFAFGGSVSSIIADFFNTLKPQAPDLATKLLWEGLFGGFVAGITLVIPYAIPFYILLSVLEDTGYITRIAYLLDGIAHKVGFHGKAIIPMILGYGCNVPACFGCRILEYERDRLVTAFAVTLIPCTARTVVILALVGAYLGAEWAIGIYIFNLAVIAILAKIAFKALPGEPMGLIMEMPPYRIPSPGAILKHTWWKIKSILLVVFPYYMVGGLIFAVAYLVGAFDLLNSTFAPITEGWLGLPAYAATLLLFGIVSKELIVVLPAVLYATTDLSTILTPVQMIVLTVVALFYIPCLATIEALRREFGLGKALAITAFEIVFAIVLGGLVYRALGLVGIF